MSISNKYSIPEDEIHTNGIHGYKTKITGSNSSKIYLHIHGFGGNCEHLLGRKIAKAQYEQNNIFYRISLRGNGKSHLSFNEMTLTTQAEDIKNIVEYIISKHKNKKISVIGYSMGATSILAGIYKYKNILKNFEHFYFLAPSFDFLQNRKKRLGEEGMKNWGNIGYIEVEIPGDSKAQLPYSFIHDAENFKLKEAYKAIDKPITIIHGNEDDIVPINCSKDMLKIHKKNIDFHELKDGHKLIKTYQEIEDIMIKNN